MNSTLINFLISIIILYTLKKKQLKIFYNKKFILISKILYKQGLIQNFFFFVFFKKFKIVSKPSYIIYFSFKDINKIDENKIFYTFSTSLDYLTSLESNHKKNFTFKKLYGFF